MPPRSSAAICYKISDLLTSLFLLPDQLLTMTKKLTATLIKIKN